MDFCKLDKSWLDKSLKSPVSEDPSTSNMVNGPKHYFSQNGSAITIFIYLSEGKRVGKSLCLSEIQNLKTVC